MEMDGEVQYDSDTTSSLGKLSSESGRRTGEGKGDGEEEDQMC